MSSLKVIVLDRHSLPGQESSARANGGVRAQFGAAANIQLSLYSIGEFERLEMANPGKLGFLQAGYLFIAGSLAAEQRLRAGLRLQRALGVDVAWIEPADVLRLAPIIRAKGLRGGTFGPRDGFIDPHAVVAARWNEGKELGVEFRFDTEVQAIEPSGNRGFNLKLSSGELHAAWVVNAAGASAGQIARLLDVDVPVRPVRRNLAVTEPVQGAPDIIPMCVDVDSGVLVRREGRAGYLLAYSNPNDVPGWDTTVDPKFFDDLAHRIGNRFPLLADVPIDTRKCWAGLYPETPDHNAIIGAVPGLPRFLQCVGFGGHGIMHSPAAGRAVAELICLGRCETFDLHSFRLARFADGDLSMEMAVL